MKTDENIEATEAKDERKHFSFQNTWIRVALGLVGLFVFAAGIYGYLYFTSPANIRHPSFDHYHFRTQIIVDGEPVDFSREEFQEDISTGASSCSIALNGTPIDFHDNEDQMTHIHWGGITGGQFLKYYGWNFTGGDDDSLGRRYDQGMMRMHRIDVKGDMLPDIPEQANFYIYIGDENSYEQKDWNDFLNLDLEEFFGKQSNISKSTSSFNILDLISGKAYAHGMIDDGHEEDEDDAQKDEATLERINNLIGNMVIFVQRDEPSQQQVQERFNNLVPLHESTCGG